MKKILVTGCLMACLVSVSAQVPVYLDDSQPVEMRVSDALSRMTLEEKVAICHAQSKFRSNGVPRLGIPALHWSDGPHGVRMELNWNDWGHAGWTNDSVTAFPALTCLAATWNPALSEKYGASLGEEARYRGKDVMLGPGVNIYRTPMNGRNFEYMGEDPYLASEMVVPYIKGMQRQGVAACVKHFFLNNQEQWRDHINVEVSERALHEIYLPAFKAAVERGGTWALMGSYNKYLGVHCCHNDVSLNRLLKHDWNFDGVVVTDWGGAHDTYEAAMNGLDVEMGTYTDGLTTESAYGYEAYYLATPYLNMIKEGKVPEATVNEKAARILRLIFRTEMNRNRPYGSIATDEHYATAREIGGEGIVLMKNEAVMGGKLLPIDASKYNRILVVGDNAVRMLNEGGGSSELKVKDMVSPLLGLQEVYGDKISFVQGYKAGRPMYGVDEPIALDVQDKLRAEAVEAARNADLVIVIGGLNKNAFQDCEGVDRKEFGLPFGQDKLIEELASVQPRLVFVALTGNAFAMPWLKKVPALVEGWYIGSMAGRAIADVLSGKVNPSGKLPFSFPARLSDNGAHHYGTISYPGDSINQVYKDDVFVGYRWHDTKKIPALFPFGHGLSYTTFAYSKPRLSASEIADGDSITLSVDVTNTGSVAGKEVVQLYIGDEKASVARPVKELKHFCKVSLAPGETRTVTFTISCDDLKFYDEALHDWKAEQGKFHAYVASSSADIRGKVAFVLKQ